MNEAMVYNGSVLWFKLHQSFSRLMTLYKTIRYLPANDCRRSFSYTRR